MATEIKKEIDNEVDTGTNFEGGDVSSTKLDKFLEAGSFSIKLEPTIEPPIKSKEHSGSKSHVKNFHCLHCDFQTAYSGNLKRHTYTAHTNGRRLKGRVPILKECPYCEYRYRDLSAINRHLRIHTGQRPYRCDQCDFSATQAYSLTIHQRSIHTKERPFKCDQCDYAASRTDVLARHLLTHSGVKRFACKFCNLKIATDGELKRHIARNHLDYKQFQCQQCEYAANTRYEENTFMASTLLSWNLQ